MMYIIYLDFEYFAWYPYIFSITASIENVMIAESRISWTG